MTEKYDPNKKFGGEVSAETMKSLNDALKSGKLKIEKPVKAKKKED